MAQTTTRTCDGCGRNMSEPDCDLPKFGFSVSTFFIDGYVDSDSPRSAAQEDPLPEAVDFCSLRCMSEWRFYQSASQRGGTIVGEPEPFVGGGPNKGGVNDPVSQVRQRPGQPPASNHVPPATRFRWHRGGLAESMDTLIMFAPNVSSLDQLVAEVKRSVEEYGNDWLSPAATDPKNNLRVSPYSALPDGRIGWPCTWIVTVRNGDPWVPIGFTDGPVPGVEQSRTKVTHSDAPDWGRNSSMGKNP